VWLAASWQLRVQHPWSKVGPILEAVLRQAASKQLRLPAPAQQKLAASGQLRVAAELKLAAS
jgi:hypothetical protein